MDKYLVSALFGVVIGGNTGEVIDRKGNYVVSTVIAATSHGHAETTLLQRLQDISTIGRARGLVGAPVWAIDAPVAAVATPTTSEDDRWVFSPTTATHNDLKAHHEKEVLRRHRASRGSARQSTATRYGATRQPTPALEQESVFRGRN